jgi:hypothetical protein
MNEMKLDASRMDFLQAKIGQGTSPDPKGNILYTGNSDGDRSAINRLERFEAGLPVVEKLVSELQTTPPAPSQLQEEQNIREATITIIREKEEAAKSPDIGKILLPAGVGLAVGTLLVLAARGL